MAQERSKSQDKTTENPQSEKKKVVRSSASPNSLHDQLAQKAPPAKTADIGTKASPSRAPNSADKKTPQEKKTRTAKKNENQTASKPAVSQRPARGSASPKTDDPAPELVKPAPRRRPAGPAREHIAANDDMPSIGGLIYALNQKPTNQAFFVATIATVVWSILGLLLSWSVIGTQISKINVWTDLFTNPSTIVVAATIIIPIALFWFLALLIWRAQELKLMSSAMTEVAVRLAEPDRMAEQQVASLGQTVRRQVAAMNDAIGRALGRAGELEALVHNEVAALERSYGDNEIRIRGLIDELASEREALANNSERVSESLRGVGQQVAREIGMVTEQITSTLANATDTIAGSLATKGEKLTMAITAAGTAIDERIAERGTKITEQIVTQGAQAADKLEKVGNHINHMLRESSDRTAALVSSSGNSVVATLSSMNERISKEIPGLLERLGGEQLRLSHIIDGATKNLSTLESALGKRTQSIEAAVAKQVHAVDSVMVERTKALDAAFSQRVQHLDSMLTNQSERINASLIERSEAFEGALVNQAASFDETFVRGVKAFRETTERMSTEAVRTVEDLAVQAEVLRDVSEGLLQQVHSLTSRFETRGQSIMKAAHSLESSQFRIDAVLETRQTELSGLLENISEKAENLDKMMRSYSGKLDSSLTEAEQRAEQLSVAIHTKSQLTSDAALAHLEQLKSNTQIQAEKAVKELRSNFSTVAREVTTEITSLTSEFSEITKQVRERAKRAAGELEATQTEMRQRIDVIPDTAREGADAMRQAIQDQISAIGSLTALANEQGSMRDVSPPSNRPHATDPAWPRPGGRTGQSRQAFRATEMRSEEIAPAHYDSSGHGGKTRDLGSIASNVARTLEHQRRGQSASKHPPQPAPPISGPDDEADQSSRWSMGDLLARASEGDGSRRAASRPQRRPAGSGRAQTRKSLTQKSLSMDAIARAIDHNKAAELWQRYKSGERGFIDRNVYTHDGRTTFDEIHQRYDRNPDFRDTVDRYLSDFEHLLKEAEKREPDGQLVQNYLTSETGRVYLLLAHASGRLG
ncbi:hypothetical protein MnTg02_03284 [bacterium MnTg02]|nr:hypothetical protein MnTg02_03284 [bacterium MnTg02]